MNMPDNRVASRRPAQGRPGDHIQEDRIKDQDEDGGLRRSAATTARARSAPSKAASLTPWKSAEARAGGAPRPTTTPWPTGSRRPGDRLIPVGIIPVAEPRGGRGRAGAPGGLWASKLLTVPTYPVAYDLARRTGRSQYAPLWAGVRGQPGASEPPYQRRSRPEGH